MKSHLQAQEIIAIGYNMRCIDDLNNTTPKSQIDEYNF